MRRSTEGLIALQFLAVALPMVLVLLAQLTADSRLAATLASSRPLRNLASEARSTARDEAVVRDAVATAERQRRSVAAALLVSFALSGVFVLATRSRLKRQIEADAAIERRRRTELEAISIRFNLATEAAGAGVYEVREQDSHVWWSDTMRALYAQPDLNYQPTLAAWLAFIHPEDRGRAAAAMSAALRECHQLRSQYRVVLPHGAIRHIESQAIVVADPAGQGALLLGIDLDVTARVAAIEREQQLQGQLREASRNAGMAEVATSVLHNVGNVLNNVNVSASLVADNLRRSKAAGLGRVAQLLREHEHELGRFVGEDERGRQLPAYLEGLSRHMLADQGATLQELESLRRNIDHIKEIVAMQQSYAKLAGVSETVIPSELVEECLRISAGDFAQHGIAIVREFAPVPKVALDKHKVLQILVNLLRNAKHACQKHAAQAHAVVIRLAPATDGITIAVHDDGVGIAPENMTRIFLYGFTTKQEGHGFGLHGSALAAREMGGSLLVASAGPGLGATFTLELPLHPPGAANG